MWFGKAIEASRAARAAGNRWVPSIRTALTLWKADQIAEMRRECELLLDEHAAWASGGLEGAGEQELRRFRIAQEATAAANLLLGRYEEAVTAAKAVLGGKDGPNTRMDTYGVLLLSTGARDNDHETFEEGLDFLSEEVDRWPTPVCSMSVDLFRFGLSLPFCSAEEYIRWRMVGPDEGTKL